MLGTSSLRRGAQLARKYPNLVVQDIRGNLNTRLAKLDAANSKFAGIILAQAGLKRMGWENRINQVSGTHLPFESVPNGFFYRRQTLDADDILYAVGQGALAVECRSNDDRILEMLQKLCCLQTQCKILTERSFLKTLGGGCSAPVAVITNLKRKSTESDEPFDYHELHITGAVWSLDGSIEVQSDINCLLNLNYSESVLDCDQVIPCKRAKLCKTPEPNAKAATAATKPRSPTIVDDTKLALPSGSDLLKIHGDLLKKCPNVAHHQSAGDSEKCPLNFAVGQDVMGQCPYLSSEQIILASVVNSTDEQSSAASGVKKCPLKGAGGPDVVAQCPYLNADTKINVSTALSNDTVVGAQSKCPYAVGEQVRKSEEPVLPVEPSKKLPDSAKKSTDTDDSEESDETVDDTTLYCGLYRHQCYNIDWFEKCEQLGQSLAKSLIEKGALKVMEKAQQEIRSAI